MRIPRLALFVCLVALWPSTARADVSGWLAWLEELSGPGPFVGYIASFPIPCRIWERCHVGPRKTQTIVVRLGRLSSGDRPRFKDLENTPFDDRRSVHVWPVSVLWMFHPHPSFEIGPGAGFIAVSGEGFKGFAKLSLTPLNASFAPFAVRSDSRWAQLFRIELDTSYVPQGFSGADFKNDRTAFDSGAEFLTRAAIGLDIGGLIAAIRRK